MERKLTDKERDALLYIIKNEGHFSFRGKLIERVDITGLDLFPDNCKVEDEDNNVSFKGGCQFTEHYEGGDMTGPATFIGSAEMNGLNEFILSQKPISITK